MPEKPQVDWQKSGCTVIKLSALLVFPYILEGTVFLKNGYKVLYIRQKKYIKTFKTHLKKKIKVVKI